MAGMKIKAIFMDMDGTLLRSDHTMSDKLKEKLIELDKNGVKIFISTGRMYAAALPYLKQLGITTPVITYNGGKIVDPSTSETLYENPVTAETVKRVIEVSRETGIHLNLYSDDKLYVENETPEGKAYAEKTGLKYVLVNFDEFIGKTSTKALFLGENEKLVKLKEELEKELPQSIFVFSQPTYLEVLNKGVSKGKAVKELMNKYGFSEDEVMTFGDQWNDFDMLKLVKYGYLMGNASEDLKKEFTEDRITLSNDDEGIYHIIKDNETSNNYGQQACSSLNVCRCICMLFVRRL